MIQATFIRNRSARIIFCRLLMYAMMAHALPAAAAGSVPLAWDPSAGATVAGYKIYYGVASHAYTNSIDVGNVTNATITGLKQNTTYYFAATTYNSARVESGFSNEAKLGVLPPTPPVMTQISHGVGQFAFAISGVTNLCVVEASTNMVNWVAVQTNSAPFTFVDNNSSQFKQRFYRTYYMP